MKKLIFLFVFVFATFLANAQDFNISYNTAGTDTLENADTVIYVIDYNMLARDDFNITNQLQADSISGTTAATAYFQVSNFSTGDVWYSLDTISISGSSTTDYSSFTLNAMRARWYVLSTGTQKTVLKFATKGSRK